MSALDALTGQKFYAIIARMGSGKTAIALRDAERLYNNGEIDCLLVTAPPGVTTQWLREQAPQWLRCSHVSFAYRSKSSRTKKYLADVDAALAAAKAALLVVAIHFEAFATNGGIDFVEWLMKTRRVMWVIDESTKIKNPKASRTKAIIRLAQHAKFRRIMTGTPATRGLECMWAQYRFLDPSILGASYWAFRSRYCELEPVWGAPAGAVKITGYKFVDELMGKIGKKTFYGGGDLPEKTYVRRIVDLTPRQLALYTAASKALDRYSADDPELDVPNVLAQMVLMQRIICGHMPDLNEVYGAAEVPSLRAEVAIDIVEETDGKVIIWHRFAHDAFLLAREMTARMPDIKFVKYSGKIDINSRVSAIDAIRYDDQTRVMIAQLQAASHGLDIPQVGTSIYYSGTFDAEVRWQSEDRQRPGLMHPGVYVDLISHKTIDDDIAENNARKGTVADFVRDFLRKINRR